MNKNVRVTTTRLPFFMLLFGLGWTAFSAIFVVVGITTGDIFFTLFGAGFVLIGLLIAGYGMLVFYSRMRVGVPDIHISQTTLRVGESFAMNYLHQFKNRVEIDELLIQFIFRETATYQQGTDTRTVRHDHVIQEYREPGQTFRAGQRISNAYEFRVPPDGMHTLKVRRNELEWYLRFQMTIPRLPDFVEEYELTVLPELLD